LLNNYEHSNITIKDKYHGFIVENNFENNSVSDFLLSINFKNKEILDDLAIVLNYSFDNFLESNKPYLTKPQINALIGQGFTFGAHSESHPLYSQLPLTSQIDQTSKSVDWLQKEFDVDYKAFSFPFTDLGVSINFYELMKKENMLDISFGTSGIKRDLVKNNLQRISFEEAGKSAKLFLLKAYIKYFFKIPLGKSIMKRIE